ncbi:very-long-chain enoyl-CoA reductase-like isoform X3 [Scleropages formosus]|uniref:Very-long-chain enoyl-CoA reductase n=1 Tax=Scleropages formosus TaxID=113540 RepID=A0A8C9RD71_SCLFO|nr:very-long-chain enoyl-CoA reductase-like isoform X3 [Scleropages formosus]
MSRAAFFEVEILDPKTKAQLCFLDKVEPHATVAEIKCLLHKCYPKWYPARQALKLDPKGKTLKDDEILENLPVGTTATMYFKDLGPQLGWTMVFLAEYIGPLFIYLLFYFRLPYIYSPKYTFTSSPYPVVPLACLCHSFHYVKRLIETIFVHRFSHGTMPLRSMVKNCLYYWGFAAWLAYYINHPLYTPPSYGNRQIYYALILFLLCEAGNFSINLALNNLKSDGRCMDWVHIHDTVCSSGPVHTGGLHPDDYLGSGKAQDVPSTVQGLPCPQNGNHPTLSVKGQPACKWRG